MNTIERLKQIEKQKEVNIKKQEQLIIQTIQSIDKTSSEQLDNLAHTIEKIIQQKINKIAAETTQQIKDLDAQSTAEKITKKLYIRPIMLTLMMISSFILVILIAYATIKMSDLTAMKEQAIQTRQKALETQKETKTAIDEILNAKNLKELKSLNIRATKDNIIMTLNPKQLQELTEMKNGNYQLIIKREK